ncbi:MAG: Gfo/Idh/MocA family oxidoreductase [Verrucomicrobia bacterium]|nr:Gfo/Idh/MocA family oxidoreductase [Verrucomicrobiota bacterium]
MNTIISRRSFLSASITAAAAFSVPRWTWAAPAGANSDIRVAVVGIRGRGKSHISGFSGLPGVRIVALCDVDSDELAKGVASFEKKNQKVQGYTDIRKLLENKDIDVVSIATPNHWQALATIWACQAGKDVYVEKPSSHNVFEGRQAVRAAEKYKRIVQAGMQCRSSIGLRQGIEFIRKGGLGKVLVSRGLCYKRRESIGKTSGPQAIPPSVDYDLWCGPAPKDPPRRNSKNGPIHYDWHWFWAYGNGDIGNQGVHQMDICRWALGINELSPRVISIGGRFGYEDDAETPNTQIAYHDYDGTPLIFEVRGLPEKSGAKNMDKFLGASVGCVIHCENGYMTIPSYSQAIVYDKDGKEVQKFPSGGGSGGKKEKAKKEKGKKGDAGAASGVVMDFVEDSNHFGNFIRAVRSRKVADQAGPILQGHLSAGLCHTANISYRVGKQASPGQILEQIKGNRDAAETFGRFKEHLAANDVNIDTTKAVIGPWLKMNPKTERFDDNKAANELLTRKYRAPFVVPAKV